jgi:hypothetical protein
MKYLQNIARVIVIILSTLVYAKSSDGAIEEALQHQVKAVAQITSLSYEINGQQSDVTSNSQKWEPTFIFRYWWQGQRWRAERVDIVNGKENPVYVEAFNGKQYQLLDFNTGQLKLASKTIPLGAAPRHSCYDNAPLALLDFLEFEDPVMLPSYLRAAPLEDVLSWEKWSSFFTSATVEAVTSGSSESQIYRIVNAHLGGDLFSNFSKVTFDPATSLFPAVIERFHGKGENAARVFSMRVTDIQKTPLDGFEMPKNITIDFYSNLKAHELLYERKDQISNIKVDAKVPDAFFNVDVNLASDVWDMDNRVTFSTGANGHH